MSSKFVTLLEDVGKDIEKGIAKVVPIINKVDEDVTKVEPIVDTLDPAVGPILDTVLGVGAQSAQLLTAIGKAGGATPEAVIANAIQVASPAVTKAFQDAGKPADAATVNKYITAAINLLDAIPASTTAPAASPASAS